MTRPGAVIDFAGGAAASNSRGYRRPLSREFLRRLGRQSMNPGVSQLIITNHRDSTEHDRIFEIDYYSMITMCGNGLRLARYSSDRNHPALEWHWQQDTF